MIANTIVKIGEDTVLTYTVDDNNVKIPKNSKVYFVLRIIESLFRIKPHDKALIEEILSK